LPRAWLIPLFLFLYLFHLGAVGFIAPDEPRYASVGREMAASHDLITPRLDHRPWFEKPPLIYWMIAASRALRLDRFGDEWAARLPVALASLAFLAFFYSILAREFSRRVALSATLILATSAGWIAYSSAAATDLPMSAALMAAILIAIFDTRRSQGYLAGALLGLAVLAKAFVPLVLFVPPFLISRGKRLAMLAGCVLVAAPWHLAAWARNGSAFWQDYFWKQQVSRFFSLSLQHGQPVWFYLPVILLGLFPWTPLAALLFRPKTFDDVRVRFFTFWLLYALLFFSAARNKLPGYALPLLPALAIILAAGLDRAGAARKWWIATAALPLVALPAIIPAIPDAMLSGISRASFAWRAILAGLPFAIAGLAAWWLALRERTGLAVTVIAIAAAIGVIYVKVKTFPPLDDRVSVRAFARANAASLPSACIEDAVRRQWRYGLNYYANRDLPTCTPSAQNRITEQNGSLKNLRASASH
jgi:4-amino-4-deoxy-L-arabinose transferase-like glycosyltransferase